MFPLIYVKLSDIFSHMREKGCVQNGVSWHILLPDSCLFLPFIGQS